MPSFSRFLQPSQACRGCGTLIFARTALLGFQQVRTWRPCSIWIFDAILFFSTTPCNCWGPKSCGGCCCHSALRTAGSQKMRSSCGSILSLDVHLRWCYIQIMILKTCGEAAGRPDIGLRGVMQCQAGPGKGIAAPGTIEIEPLWHLHC